MYGSDAPIAQKMDWNERIAADTGDFDQWLSAAIAEQIVQGSVGDDGCVDIDIQVLIGVPSEEQRQIIRESEPFWLVFIEDEDW